MADTVAIIPIIAATIVADTIVAIAAVPAIALAVFRVERTIRQGRDDGPY